MTEVSYLNKNNERVNVMKKWKQCSIAGIMLVLIMVLGVGCINAENKVPTDQTGLVMEGIDAPKVVLDATKSQVEQFFNNNRMDFPDYNYTNWRIEKLVYSYTYDNLNGMQIAIYQMNYEFLSESPENVVLAGGMYITEDNWVMPSYPNATYLIFKQEDDQLTFLQSIVENDCTPGTQLFTEDLQQILTS